MLNTYIKNKGHTKTIIHNNNKNRVNELDWDAEYDGNNANILLTTTNNGKKKKIGIQLDNNDLANLLNISSINMPLHRRLKEDFIKKPSPKLLQIQLPDRDLLNTENLNDTESQEIIEFPEMETPEIVPIQPFYSSVEDLLSSQNFLSSPLPDDKLIIPITINDRLSHDYTLTPRRHHRRPKTHKTYRVYKVQKNSKHTARSKTKSNSSRSSRKSR